MDDDTKICYQSTIVEKVEEGEIMNRINKDGGIEDGGIEDGRIEDSGRDDIELNHGGNGASNSDLERDDKVGEDAEKEESVDAVGEKSFLENLEEKCSHKLEIRHTGTSQPETKKNAKKRKLTEEVGKYNTRGQFLLERSREMS